MQFNVNESVVKMIEILANNKSLQILIVVLAVIVRMPEIITALAVFLTR